MECTASAEDSVGICNTDPVGSSWEGTKAGLSQRRVSVKSWKDLTGMSFWTLTPRRILWDVVAIAEVIVSIVVHLSYGLSIFGCAVWIDVMSILSASSSSI